MLTAGQTLQTRPVGIDGKSASNHHVTVQLLTLSHPATRLVPSCCLCNSQSPAFTGHQILHPDHRFFRFKRHVGDLGAIRDHDGEIIGSLERNAADTFAVSISNFQTILAPALVT
jgi:hypothetical protein